MQDEMKHKLLAYLSTCISPENIPPPPCIKSITCWKKFRLTNLLQWLQHSRNNHEWLVSYFYEQHGTRL